MSSTDESTPLKSDDNVIYYGVVISDTNVNYGSTRQSTSTSATNFYHPNTVTGSTQAPNTSKKSKPWSELWVEIEPEGFREFRQRNVGLLLIVASEAFFTFMNLSVKTLHDVDPPVTTLQLILVRMIITYICSITYMLSAGIPDPLTGPKGVRLLLVFRGFAGFFGLFGIYFSLQYLSLSDATVLTFLAPLFTGFAGSLFLGEHLSYKQVLAGLISLFGVVLIARPPLLFGGDDSIIPILNLLQVQDDNPEKRMLAVFVALIGVLGATGAYTSLRAIGKRAHPLHALVSFSSQSVLAASIGMIITKEPFIVPTRPAWLGMLALIGVFGFIAQILLTMGLARETAGRGTMALYIQIVFATILERIFFHTSPSLLSTVGTFLIISSALYVAFMKVESGNKATAPSSLPSKTDQDETMERGLVE